MAGRMAESVMADNSPDRRKLLGGLAVVGSEMTGFAIVGLVIDFALGTIHAIPWATLILAPLGLIVALFHLIQLVKRGRQP